MALKRERVSQVTKTLLVDIGVALIGSFIIALLAQVEVPSYPVPYTLQTLGVSAIAAAVGGRRAFLTLAAYLLEGACGLPVFAGGGLGLLYLIGPTGGYLWGFLVGGYLMGKLCEKRGPFISILIGNLVILSMGAAYLACLIGPAKALALGLYPFLFSTLLKVAIAANLVPLMRRFQNAFSR